ncbi:MAG TPA: glycosyltransferase [Thermoanaerobaculia bacterium]|nr:glycosyltransferase [Thermoanaerobaculia bacterium]
MLAPSPAEPRRTRIVGISLLFALLTAAAVAVLITSERLMDATIGPASPLLLAAGLLFGLLVLRYSAAGLPLLVVLVYLNVSQALVRYHEFPSLLQLLVVILAFAAWLGRDTVPVGSILSDPITIAAAGLLALAFVTTAFAADRAAADARVLELAKAVVIYGLVTLLIRDRSRLLQGLGALVASAAVLGLMPIVQWITGNYDWQFGGLARIKDAHIYGRVFQERFAGPIGDPNFFAQVLLLVFPLPLLIGLESNDRRKRLTWLAAAAVILITILLTYSRGAMLAVAVMGLALVRTLHIRWRTTLIVILIAIASLVFLPRSVTERFLTIEQILPTSEAALRPDSSFQERRLLMRVAWIMFGANPILGVGAGNYSARYDDYVDQSSSAAREYAAASDLHFPHNLPLEIAAETGLAGLIVFGGLIAAALMALAGARRRFAQAGDRILERAATAMMIGLAGFLIAGLFLHFAFPRYLFLVLGLVAGLRRVSEEAASRHEPRRSIPHAPPTAPLPPVPAGPPVRRPIAVLLSRFPLITETFILREISELERQGQPVVLVPMIEEHPRVVHDEARPWQERAICTPFLSIPIARATIRTLVRRPRLSLTLLAWIVRGSVMRPDTLVRSLMLFPKSVYLASRLRDEGVAHLHAHFATHPATMALIISSLTSIPFSFTVHAHDIFVDRSLLRRKLREASFVRAISQFNRLFLERLHPMEAAGKIEVVHVGIDPRRYVARAAEPSRSATPTVLCVAALKPYKGLTYLIRASRILASEGVDFRVEIVGRGPLAWRLRAEIARHHLTGRVVLRGALTQSEVARAVAACEVFVLPSIIAADGQMEGIPVSLMEAMAARKPVVATAISGIPELVEHEVSGLLIDPANPNHLAAAIRELLDNPDKAARLGRAGAGVVAREFSLEPSVRALIGVIDRHAPPGRLELTSAAAAAIPAAAWGLRCTHQRIDSRVVELIAAAPGGPREIIVKQHLPRSGESRPPQTRAEEEYEVLRRLAEAFEPHESGGVTLGVPAAISLDRSAAIVVMERARGTPMDVLIRRARKGSRPAIDRLLAAAAGAGAWIAALQRTGGEDGGPLLERLAGRAEALASSGKIARGFAGLARRRIERLATRLASSPRRGVAHHGDFWPGNVFFSPDRVEVIDLEGFRFGLPAEDLAWFLVHARLYLAFRHPELLRRVERGLLEGYGAPIDRYELGLARLACALELLASGPRDHPIARRVLRRAILLRELVR